MGIEPTNNGFADRCLTTWLPDQMPLQFTLSEVEGPLRQISIYRVNYYSDTKHHSQRDNSSFKKPVVPNWLFFLSALFWTCHIACNISEKRLGPQFTRTASSAYWHDWKVPRRTADIPCEFYQKREVIRSFWRLSKKISRWILAFEPVWRVSCCDFTGLRHPSPNWCGIPWILKSGTHSLRSAQGNPKF